MTRSLPEDPIIRRLVQQARAAQLSRRTVLQGRASVPQRSCSPRVHAGKFGKADRGQRRLRH